MGALAWASQHRVRFERLAREAAGVLAPAGFACSAEDVLVLELIRRHELPVRVVALDPGRLPQETHDLIDAVRARFGLPIGVMYPNGERLEALCSAEGVNSFYRSSELRQSCCRVRKVEPLGRALAGCRSWITGLRREQAVTRDALDVLHFDETYKLMKCNPLAVWTEGDVWAGILAWDLHYNTLYDMGYRSIGCAPCTRAVRPGDDARSGRWWWEAPQDKECGLHVAPDGRLVRASHAAQDAPANAGDASTR